MSNLRRYNHLGAIMRLALTAVAAILAAQAAQAVTLQPTPCTATCICANPGPSVDYIHVSSAYGRVTASIDGVMYDSGIYAVSVIPTTEYPVTVTLYGPNGGAYTLNATFLHWSTLVNSGRAHYYAQHYMLEGGTLTP